MNKIEHSRKISVFYLYWIVGSGLLLWMALFNHYPILYTDSFGYVDGATLEMKSIGYYLFIKVSSFGHSLWFVVLFQALVTSYLLLRIPCLIYKNTPRIEWLSFLSLSILVSLTSISQYVCWIMPDIFTGWIFLICLLFFLSPCLMEGLFLSALMALCISSHNSHVLIGFVLIFLSLALMVIFKKSSVGVGRIFLKIILSIVLSFMFLCVLNMAFMGASKFQIFSPDGGRFIVAKLASNGILSKTLEKYCGKKKWHMCQYSKELSAVKYKDPQLFIWDNSFPFRKYRLFGDNQQINEINKYALKTYPFELLKYSVMDTIKMMTDFKFDGIPYIKKIAIYRSRFKRNPRDIDLYYSTRQYQKSYIPKKLLPVDDRILGVLSVFCAVIFTLFYLYRKNYYFVALLLGCVLFILVNDFITASISGPYARYQMRILWLLPYVLIIINLKYLSKTLPFTKAYEQK